MQPATTLCSRRDDVVFATRARAGIFNDDLQVGLAHFDENAHRFVAISHGVGNEFAEDQFARAVTRRSWTERFSNES